MYEKFQGLMAAVFTPFNNDSSQSVDYSKIDAYAKYLVEVQNIRAILVNGTTGESLKLSVPERKLLLEHWLVSGEKHGIKVYVHVGHNSLPESSDLTKHAVNCASPALSGIVAMAPTFFKPNTPEILVNMMAKIAEAAPLLPFYYYHIPSMTGVNIDVLDILTFAEESGLIPNLAGVKYSDANLHHYALAAQYKEGKYDMIYGCDQQLLYGIQAGVQGAIGSTYNYIAAEAYDVLHNHSLEAQLKISKVVKELHAYGSSSYVGKEILAIQGFDCGVPRLPHKALDARNKALLENKLGDILHSPSRIFAQAPQAENADINVFEKYEVPIGLVNKLQALSEYHPNIMEKRGSKYLSQDELASDFINPKKSPPLTFAQALQAPKFDITEFSDIQECRETEKEKPKAHFRSQGSWGTI